MTEPASTSKALIELDRISKVFQMGDTEVRALDDVSLSVSGGEFWAIMGASGSGKSTMLNLVGCLDRATSGRYVLDGRDISGLNDDELSEVRLRHMGFIFQSFNLIPQLTVERNIELPLYYLGWDAEESRAKARELAAQVGLADRLRHRPTELSGGQQQRVAIARALANNPSVVLADEPTGNLDTPTGEQIMSLLRDLNQQGKTIIMVTHERELAAYATHELHMRDGKIARVIANGEEAAAA